MHKTKLLPSLFLLFFVLFSVPLFAQQPLIDIDESSQNWIMAAEVQHCDYYTNFNVNHLPVIRNSNQIPAYGLYKNLWDTLYIRNAKIEIPFFDNQLKIMVLQEGNTPFAFPISGTLSTGYIKNRGKQHSGVDFSVTKREPVVACFDGVVRIAKKFEEYGNTVVVRHYNGLETLYALLDNVQVVTGQILKAGELLGYVNLTTPSRKNALHFETRFLNEFFNPEKLIDFSERKLQGNILTLTPEDFISIPVVPPPSAEKTPEKTPEKTTKKTSEKTPEKPATKTTETTPNHNASQEQLLNTPKSLPVFHTVAQGETIFRICTKYNITEQQLRSLNNIKGTHIEVGQKLRIQ
ncbi:MAG: peptidoglycan DD-metalloendopeptidase family protein [Lentimicrobiaceae bacterium]|nr:peptidoglycan DD-metalloendopeptidase family protein [Lentimicrobiaceae bacterium]